jgi:hypothetical protein
MTSSTPPTPLLDPSIESIWSKCKINVDTNPQSAMSSVQGISWKELSDLFNTYQSKGLNYHCFSPPKDSSIWPFTSSPITWSSFPTRVHHVAYLVQHGKIHTASFKYHELYYSFGSPAYNVFEIQWLTDIPFEQQNEVHLFYTTVRMSYPPKPIPMIPLGIDKIWDRCSTSRASEYHRTLFPLVSSTELGEMLKAFHHMNLMHRTIHPPTSTWTSWLIGISTTTEIIRKEPILYIAQLNVESRPPAEYVIVNGTDKKELLVYWSARPTRRIPIEIFFKAEKGKVIVEGE